MSASHLYFNESYDAGWPVSIAESCSVFPNDPSDMILPDLILEPAQPVDYEAIYQPRPCRRCQTLHDRHSAFCLDCESDLAG